MVSSNFQESYTEYDTTAEGMSGPPQQLVWCGNDTLVMNWEMIVVMVGPFGTVLKCVSVFCHKHCDLLCLVQILLYLTDIPHFGDRRRADHQ